jgi:hypothetical protein
VPSGARRFSAGNRAGPAPKQPSGRRPAEDRAGRDLECRAERAAPAHESRDEADVRAAEQQHEVEGDIDH